MSNAELVAAYLRLIEVCNNSKHTGLLDKLPKLVDKAETILSKYVNANTSR